MTLPPGTPPRARGPDREGHASAFASSGAAAGPLDWPRTLTARGAAALHRDHLRRRPHASAAGALHCFVLDTSGSMLRGGRLAIAKGLVQALMRAAARDRARVALLCFGGHHTALQVPPGRPGEWRDDRIAPITGGGGTPVSDALRRADALLATHARRHPGDVRWVWLLTDGRSTDVPPLPRQAQQVRVIDFDDGRDALGRTAAWVAAWGLDPSVVHRTAADWGRPAPHRRTV